MSPAFNPYRLLGFSPSTSARHRLVPATLQLSHTSRLFHFHFSNNTRSHDNSRWPRASHPYPSQSPYFPHPSRESCPLPIPIHSNQRRVSIQSLSTNKRPIVSLSLSNASSTSVLGEANLSGVVLSKPAPWTPSAEASGSTSTDNSRQETGTEDGEDVGMVRDQADISPERAGNPQICAISYSY